jgi:hypothetical protein
MYHVTLKDSFVKIDSYNDRRERNPAAEKLDIVHATLKHDSWVNMHHTWEIIDSTASSNSMLEVGSKISGV